ncbi:type I-U CRISPR-associated protein Cas7 [Gordonia amarae]|uniref:Type I-U CRISPR-associated protein Cas7 n=2 Tax=Gordonia amarae TaxID=36821 RepID=A0A857ME39_9ACTN|nr:type I-U CRISPR-associated RAMP protein Csb1/Cas7u [Gordonia amarae]MCS3880284.1 CRISPR-associated protein Csb1 [Gordonia amarae]QHN18633.1 type I-U CRISPR-associated protein Cas7 [Gordonia amarae]QHN23108.1 type I-U CRISPR-associated protein Cas7 [Gordonia amarae]QHN32009.1 type I-U CRISPR-associated protein Cas7 [Gordonia amarae]QHN40756.1 type I-U CRISPR-associated protein Cas7 [Gordonia amarae]
MSQVSASRTRYTFELEPIAGRRFQPTGFPDLGPAIYQVPGRTNDDLIVESAQSMANHLEGTTWNTAQQKPAEELAALPYVRVVNPDGEFLTSSRLEAHRLASAYVLNGKVDGSPMKEVLPERFGLVKGKPLDMACVYREVFALDPLSLVHGVFFAQKPWAWQPKVARAITAFIEATNVEPAVSGGVKKDSVNNEAEKGKRDAKEGYGMVPHHRTEYTAETITMYTVIDEQQFASYGLSPAATELLSAVANWEVATLLNSGLRLRTACDLVVAGGDTPPSVNAASDRLAAAVAAASDDLGTITEVTFS